MKTILSIILFVFSCQLINATGYDLIINTYNDKSAIIHVSTGEFIENSFTVTLDIQWVNKALKPIKDKNSVLTVDKRNLKIYPKQSLNTMGNVNISDFSNKQIKIKFYANPRFEGGEVKIEMNLLYSENQDSAKSGKWKEVLFAQPKKLSISYKVDGGKIVDVFPPEVKVTYPVPDKKDGLNIPVISDKKTEIHLTVQDKSGVKYVKVNGVPAKNKFIGEFTTRVSLFTGHNTIKIDTEDNNGNKATIKYDILCSYQYDIELANGKYYALLIAMNDYQDDFIPDLKNPIKDANSFKSLLESSYMFESNNIHLLKNPKRKEIIQKLEELSDELEENDNLLIFYAGHGYWDGYKEVGYWLPTDANINDPSNWLRNSTIKDYIGSIKTKHTLLVTDACFSGSIFRTRSISGNQVVAYQKIYNLPSRKGMTSGTLKEVPDESVFLKTLIKRLSENTERYLPASKLFSSMRDAILNNSPNVPQYGVVQGAGDEGGEFIFIKKE